MESSINLKSCLFQNNELLNLDTTTQIFSSTNTTAAAAAAAANLNCHLYRDCNYRIVSSSRGLVSSSLAAAKLKLNDKINKISNFNPNKKLNYFKKPILKSFICYASSSTTDILINEISKPDYEIYHKMANESIDVAFLWHRLTQALNYLNGEEKRNIRKALEVSFEVHRGQKRKSGEPFVTHPVEVAKILAELKVDADTIIAGLLHDTIEDSDTITFKDIEEKFGKDVRRIVEGETRLTKVDPSASNDIKDDPVAVDFIHFFTSMTKDVRIVLVKLADRLHNMRTMDSMVKDKQMKKAKETIDVYAPLAGILGLECVKEELEDLSLKYLDPNRYEILKKNLEMLEKQQKSVLDDACEKLQEILLKDRFIKSQTRSLIVTSCQKSVYTLYKKVKHIHRLSLEDNKKLRQVARIKILIDAGNDNMIGPSICYYVLGLVHLLWTPIPNTLKDCIASPKIAAWKGLRTEIWPLSGSSWLVTPIEVQIQTVKMASGNFQNFSNNHKNTSLNGFYSHSEKEENLADKVTVKVPKIIQNGFFQNLNGKMTKNGKTIKNEKMTGNEKGSSSDYGLPKEMVDGLKRWQQEFGESMSARDFFECVRESFLSQSVYVFTPSGESVELPKGATVLDFAYHVHTEVGNRAIAAKVDGVFVGPGFVLQNAQVVEILSTMRHPLLTPDFLKTLKSRLAIVQTKSAKKKLKIFIKKISDDKNFDEEYNKGYGSRGFTWFMLEVCDKPGVLAKISNIIANYDINISKYWGYPNPKKPERCIMRYHIIDIDDNIIQEIINEMKKVEGVTDWAVGCQLAESDHFSSKNWS